MVSAGRGPDSRFPAALSGTAVAEIGSGAVIAFAIAALVAALTAASYSEFASIYSENGGGYLFSSRTFEHDTLVYTVGAMLFLGYTGTTAFYLATMDGWVFRFIQLAEGTAVPVLVYASPRGVQGPIEDYLYPICRYLTGEERSPTEASVTGTEE